MSAVKSAVVMMPAKRPAPPAWGRNLISSSVEVAERIMREAVPEAAVKISWAEVVRLVAEATPSVGVTRVGLVEKTRLVEVVPVAPAAV